MKPTLSENERRALITLGQMKPNEIKPFDLHIRAEIGRISEKIDKGNSNIAAMKSDLAEAEDQLIQDIGGFGATARVYLAYLGTTGPKTVPQATQAPAETPQEGQCETEAETEPPTPALDETPQEAPEEVPDGDDSPEPEAN